MVIELSKCMLIRSNIAEQVTYYVKITSMCFSVKTSSCLLTDTERTQKYSLHQFSTKLTRAELVKTRALFAGCTLHRSRGKKDLSQSCVTWVAGTGEPHSEFARLIINYYTMLKL